MNSESNPDYSVPTRKGDIRRELIHLSTHIHENYIFTPDFSEYLDTLSPKASGTLLLDLIARARANPLETARLLIAADRLPDAVWMIGVGITYVFWGRHSRAAEVLAAAPDDGLDEISRLVRTWITVMAQRAIDISERSVDTLFELADRFAEARQSRAARLCRMDAYGGILPGMLTSEQAERLDTLLSAVDAYDPVTDQIYARVVTALLWAGQNQIGRAEALLDEAGQHLDSIRMPALAVYLNYLHLAVAWHQRQLDKMHSIAGEIRVLSLKINHPYYALRADHLLGQAYFEEGKYTEALRVMDRAHHAADVLSLPYFQAATNLDMGSVLLLQKQYSEAEARFRKVEALSDHMELRILAGVARMNRGVVAMKRGRYGEALLNLRAVIPLFEQANAPAYLALILDNLATIYMMLGYLDPARDIFQTARTALHQADLTRQEIRPALHIAWNALLTGSIEQAYDELVALRGRAETTLVAQDRAEYAVLWAECLLARREFEPARRAFREAVRTAQAAGIAEFEVRAEVGLLELVVTAGGPPLDLPMWTDAHIDALPVQFQWKALSLRAQVHLMRGDAQAALSDYREGLNRVNQARRSVDDEMLSGYLAQATQVLYDRGYHLARQQSDPLPALDIADRYSAQVLAARSRYADDLLTGGASDLLRRLRARMVHSYGSKWVVLRYVVHETEKDRDTSVFTITQGGMRHIPLPDKRENRIALSMLTELDDSFRQDGYSSDRHSLRQQAYRALIPPDVLDLLHRDGLLVIIPSGYLHSMAFASLISPEGRSLVEYTDVLYAYSLAGLVHTLEQRDAKREIRGPGLILAQDTFDAEGYSNLPFIPQEVAAITRQHPARVVAANGLHTADLRRQGREGEFAAHDWLHIATHAHADPRTGAFDGILLGDDVLFLDDIREWQIEAGRVTLSACQTGLGHYYYGDELAGLVQSFLGLGVSSVVGTLWHTSDILSANLMRFYYDGLYRGAGTARALSEAQRLAHSDGIPPYYWASFIAAGLP